MAEQRDGETLPHQVGHDPRRASQGSSSGRRAHHVGFSGVPDSERPVTVEPSADDRGSESHASEKLRRETRSDSIEGISDGTGSVDHSEGQSVSNASTTPTELREARVGPKWLRVVPFEAQVVFALMIPICFLVGFSSELLFDANAEVALLREQEDAISAMTAFEGACMVERGNLGPYLGTTLNTTLMAVRRTMYINTHARTDARWEVYNHELMIRAQSNELLHAAATTIYDQVQRLFAVREAVLRRQITGTNARKVYSDIIVASQGLVRALFKQTNVVRTDMAVVATLALFRSLVNTIGEMRGAGNEVLFLDATPSRQLNSEMYLVKASVERQKVVLIDSIADSVIRASVDDFFASNETVLLLNSAETLIETMERGEYVFNVTRATWWASASAVMGALNNVQTGNFGTAARRTLLTESLKISAATVLTGLAAAFILFWQVQISKNMAAQTAAAKRMNVLVSTFVPRAFLRTMGVRNLVSATPGTHTEVATTMVFSDIRNFTGLSDGMSNADMFSWLQMYFKVMTRVTDFHQGTIDKFIGDAVFAFFRRPVDSVRCAIEWQSVSVFLNSQLGSTNMIRIGVGIHHGLAVFGIFGDSARRTNTLVSPEVNFASRLEGLTKHYGVRILCSDAVMEQIDVANFTQTGDPVAMFHGDEEEKMRATADEFPTEVPSAQKGLNNRYLGQVQVKGSDRTHEIFEIFQADDFAMKQYKVASKPVFEQACRLQSQQTVCADIEETVTAVLKMEEQRANGRSARSSLADSEIRRLRRFSHASATDDAGATVTPPPALTASMTPDASTDAARSPLPFPPKSGGGVAETPVERALSLLSQAEALAGEFGVRDSVIDVKRMYIASAFDSFHEK